MLGLANDVFSKYRLLNKYRDNYGLLSGRPMTDDRQLESYPIGESFSPIQGKAMTELYNKNASPQEQTNLVSGDFLHQLAQSDPQWAAMKADVVPADMDPYRADEFLMGYLTPDKADEWRNFYTPDQRKKLGKMAEYLMRGSTAPGYR